MGKKDAKIIDLKDHATKKFPKHGEYTAEELTEWLNTLDVGMSIGILEKLYKDLRDYALSHHQRAVAEYVKTSQAKH